MARGTWGAALALMLGCLTGHAAAERAPELGFVHWAYSAYFGTGWYRVRDGQDVFVLRSSPRWELDDLFGWAPPGEATLEFRLPVTLGLHRFDFDLPEIVDPENFGTFSIVPGLELEIPVTARWALRPHAYLGVGTELDGPQTAWTYWTGIKSRYRLGEGEGGLALLGSLGYIGYTPNEGASSDAIPLMAGVQAGWELGPPSGGGAPYRVDGHAIYTAYLDNLKFIFGGGLTTKVGDEWEFGLALHRGKQKLRIWRLAFDQLGLAYRTSGNGEFRGVSLLFRSVFER